MVVNKDPPEIVFKGIPASAGLAHGAAFVFLQKELNVPLYELDEVHEKSEVKRFHEALLKTRSQISSLRNKVADTLGEQEAQIFDAHMLILEDKALIDETVKEHRETSYNIDYCFDTVAKRYAQAFDQINDEYIKERATDIRDVARRVLVNLLGQNEYNILRFNEQKIIVSEDLTPSDIAEVQKDIILALVTNAGSRTSHSVIMARSLQIPAVVGLHDITQQVETDDYLIVDGYEGIVIVNPSEETLLKYGQIKREHQNIQRVFESVNPLPAKTKDGKRITLMVNIEGVNDIRKAHTVNSDGVGLFRTEAIFIRSDHLPSEDEQFNTYRNVVQGMDPLPVTIRTLDLGGDKKISSVFISDKEENPFMGFRAIRFCLDKKDLFKSQLKAILRASAFGEVNLMYPLISSVEELIQANEVLEECKCELYDKNIAFDEDIKVGCMIETPAAAMIADLLVEHSEFFSLGTNDLIQYVLAVDRVNDRVAHLYQPYHPAVIRILKHVLQLCHRYDKKVSVCGEMAGDPLFAPLLLGMGVDALSVTPSSLPEIKYLIRSMQLSKAKALADHVAVETEPMKILKLLRDFYLSQVEDVLSGEV